MDCKNSVSIIVSSCDKYSDAWYPYFELLKKYWPGHPENIYLITETQEYTHDGLNIVNVNCGNECSWSERLYTTLEMANTKYIIFSLEDYFLLDYVKDEMIEECIRWMEEDPSIVECRLHGSDYDGLVESEKYAPFRFADADTPYRLDTQVAIWNREALMSFIDLTENPWQFEGNGTKRIQKTDKKFLWLFNPNCEDVSGDVFPYKMYAWLGYGIAWGHWLCNNKEWFRQNGIEKVKFNRLGVLSEKSVKRRYAHLYLYNRSPKKWEKLIAPIWRFGIKLRKVKANIAIFGLKKGLSESWKNK